PEVDQHRQSRLGEQLGEQRFVGGDRGIEERTPAASAGGLVGQTVGGNAVALGAVGAGNLHGDMNVRRACRTVPAAAARVNRAQALPCPGGARPPCGGCGSSSSGSSVRGPPRNSPRFARLSKWSHTTRRLTSSGTAMSAPGTPHSQPRPAIDRKTTTGFISKRLPRIIGVTIWPS